MSDETRQPEERPVDEAEVEGHRLSAPTERASAHSEEDDAPEVEGHRWGMHSPERFEAQRQR
jgi:hypothetical protein